MAMNRAPSASPASKTGTMFDGRRGPHLPDEPLAEGRVVGEFGGQDLQRHRPVQPAVRRTVDDSHPAAADLLLDLVAGYL
jgi:hypothetical protein